MRKRNVIAIVDDDASLREALTGLIRSLGHRAVAFPSAEDFLNSKGRDNTSCVIADVQMQGMSGPDLHNRLLASGRPIPTILITAYPNESVRTRALEAGVKGFLIKPFNDEDLVVCIRSALGRA